MHVFARWGLLCTVCWRAPQCALVIATTQNSRSRCFAFSLFFCTTNFCSDTPLYVLTQRGVSTRFFPNLTLRLRTAAFYISTECGIVDVVDPRALPSLTRLFTKTKTDPLARIGARRYSPRTEKDDKIDRFVLLLLVSVCPYGR